MCSISLNPELNLKDILCSEWSTTLLWWWDDDCHNTDWLPCCTLCNGESALIHVADEIMACEIWLSGWKGNLCQRSLALFVSVSVLVPCAVLSVYYLLLQTFVLRLEVVLNAVLLCFYGFELLLGMMTISVFSRWLFVRFSTYLSHSFKETYTWNRL